MSRSLFPSDDSLPTWLHTVFCMVLVLPFAAPLLWAGAAAIHARHLEPLSGPEFGQYFFGGATLEGGAAMLAGAALVMYGAAFIALGWSFKRRAAHVSMQRWLPWLLLAAGVLLTLGVRSVV